MSVSQQNFCRYCSFGGVTNSYGSRCHPLPNKQFSSIRFGGSFKSRGAQGQHWTNLRACAFFDDFKRIDSIADTSAMESDFDRLVYALYGLTEEKIALVEGADAFSKKTEKQVRCCMLPSIRLCSPTGLPPFFLGNSTILPAIVQRFA